MDTSLEIIDTSTLSEKYLLTNPSNYYEDEMFWTSRLEDVVKDYYKCSAWINSETPSTAPSLDTLNEYISEVDIDVLEEIIAEEAYIEICSECKNFNDKDDCSYYCDEIDELRTNMYDQCSYTGTFSYIPFHYISDTIVKLGYSLWLGREDLDNIRMVDDDYIFCVEHGQIIFNSAQKTLLPSFAIQYKNINERMLLLNA